MILRPPRSTRTDTLFPYTTLFRSCRAAPALRGLSRPTTQSRNSQTFFDFRIWISCLGVRVTGPCRGAWHSCVHQENSSMLDDLSNPEDSSMYTLYYAPGAASFVVHWLLIDAGAECPLQRVNLQSGERSEERRVGKGCVSKCRARCS